MAPVRTAIKTTAVLIHYVTRGLTNRVVGARRRTTSLPPRACRRMCSHFRSGTLPTRLSGDRCGSSHFLSGMHVVGLKIVGTAPANGNRKILKGMEPYYLSSITLPVRVQKERFPVYKEAFPTRGQHKNSADRRQEICERRVDFANASERATRTGTSIVHSLLFIATFFALRVSKWLTPRRPSPRTSGHPS